MDRAPLPYLRNITGGCFEASLLNTAATRIYNVLSLEFIHSIDNSNYISVVRPLAILSDVLRNAAWRVRLTKTYYQIKLLLTIAMYRISYEDRLAGRSYFY